MGISDWVWATYINSSLTLADWSPGHTSSLLTHSVSPESDTITLTEINWWVWRSYSRSVTSPKPLQRSQPLHAVTGQLCGGERGGRVWSFHFALFLFLCSFFSYSWPDWTVSVTFHASAKLWMPSRRSWTCEPLSTYLNDIASPLYDLPAFHPAFPFSAFSFGWWMVLLTMRWNTLFYWSGNQIWIRKQTVRVPKLLKTHKSEELME